MGKVRFEEGQPIQELHGTYANLTFKVVNGKTIAHVKARNRRELEDDEWDKPGIIDECVAEIQQQMGDMRQAMREREAIKKRVERLYEKYQRRCKDETELMKQIRIAYLGERRKRPCDAERVKQGRLWQGKPP